jgi:hypothetical protein
MKKSLLEQLERQTQLMSFMEQSPIAAGITQAIKSGIIKSTLASLFDDEDFDDQDFDLDTKSTNVSGNVTPLTKTTTDDEFYKSILKGIGVPITDENIKFFYAWRQAEGGKARNNPFNTTQSKPGSTFYNCLKKGVSGCKSGVRNYLSSQDGIDATVRTIKNGRYQNIINALKTGDSAEKSALALKSSPWGTGELALKVVRGYNSGSSPKPPKIA